MNYQIEVSQQARREILDLPGYVRAQARQLIRELGKDPFPACAKELRGKPNIYRIWLAGNWRIAYEVDRECKRVRVLKVRAKKLVDYEGL
ncbi:MAG: type II toxin-antitoxin system RelE/ParE family toxin [Anaerolineales bacterium]|nr:type II toxin-antitoxin system RelE/ParE family toxin [Anaerolineales bacterium]